MMSGSVSYERFVQDGIAYVNLYGAGNNMMCLREDDWDLLQDTYGVSFDTPGLLDVLRGILRQNTIGYSRFRHEW